MRKINLNKLFFNNKFVLVFSAFLSLVLWVIMASTDTEHHPRLINNVPIVINLSDAAQADGLKVFSPTEDDKATVSIKGNSMIVNQVKATDLEVVAPNASTITSPGTYTFDMTVQKTGNLTDFDAEPVTPSQMIISVDRYKEKTFTIQDDITYKPGYKADTSFFVGTPTFSTDTVTVSGPEKEVSQVNKVSVQYEIGDTLTETKFFTSNLTMFDVNGNPIATKNLKLSIDKVDVTIPVLSREVLPLSVTFTNKPSGLELTASQIDVEPKTIEVAGPKDVLQNLKNVLEPLDFADVSPSNNVFEAEVNLPSTCKNLSNVPTAKVTLDLSGYSTREIAVTNFVVKNLDPDRTANVYTQNLTATVVGPESEISKLTAGNLVAQIDMSGKENFIGHTEMPVTISVSNASGSWVYGQYMANIGVSEKAG